MCIGTTINKYAFITTRYLPPYHDYRSRLVYSQIETVCDNEHIQHKAIREAIAYLGMNSEGLEVLHAADCPGRSGIGSSSTFLVGLLNALSAMVGMRMLPHELTEAAIEIEQRRMKENVGCQDQTWAAYGGFKIIHFRQNGEIDVQPFVLSQNVIDEFDDTLLMFFTKISRDSTSIAGQYVGKIATNEREQWELMRLTDRGINSIYRKDWEGLGKCIDSAWKIKASYAPGVTNNEIDNLYTIARLSGAFGGKITGAGGGGMMLLCVPPEKREFIIQEMTKAGALHIPFKFEPEGSKIIYCEPNNIKDTL